MPFLLLFLWSAAGFSQTVSVPTAHEAQKNQDSQAVQSTQAVQDLQAIQEIEDSHRALAEKAAALNRLNPLVAAPSTASAAAPAVAQAVAQLQEKLGFKQKVLRLVDLMRSQQFQEASLSIVNNPNLKWFYGAVVLAFLAFIWLRRRVLATSDRFWVKFLLKLGIGALFMVVLAGLASLFFGRPAMEILSLLSTL